MLIKLTSDLVNNASSMAKFYINCLNIFILINLSRNICVNIQALRLNFVKLIFNTIKLIIVGPERACEGHHPPIQSVVKFEYSPFKNHAIIN